MEATQIINRRGSKSQKMRDLFDLGYTRLEVSELMNVGYGFVQNVYQKYYQTGRFALASEFNFRFDRTFGIEIEAYGCDSHELARRITEAGVHTTYEGYNHTTREHWKIVYDASLNGRNSFEVVSPVLKGEEGIRQLEIVTRILNEMDAKVNRSCGLHVHIGVEDYKLKDWKRLFKNYIKMETTIDAFMPLSRRGNSNQYCRSLKKSNYKQKIDNSSNLRELQNTLVNGNRYHKLNTQAYWRQKTVEFRQHSGTVNFDKISNWVRFTMRLTEFSKKETVTNGNEMNKFCNEDIINFYKNRTEELAS